MSEPTPSAIPVAELLNRRVSFFESLSAVLPAKQMTIGGFLRSVRSGKWRKPVKAVRIMPAKEVAP